VNGVVVGCSDHACLGGIREADSPSSLVIIILGLYHMLAFVSFWPELKRRYRSSSCSDIGDGSSSLFLLLVVVVVLFLLPERPCRVPKDSGREKKTWS
jgi:hypothetical protein